MREFVFPANFQELSSRAGRSSYYVDEVVSTRQVPLSFQDVKTQYSRNGGLSLLTNFDFFYSVINNFKDLNPVVQQQVWQFLLKESEKYCTSLNDVISNCTSSQMEHDVACSHRNTLKMNFYLFVQFADQFFNVYKRVMMENKLSASGKGKRGKGKTLQNGLDWEGECENLLRLMIKLMDLRLGVFWENHIVEDEFVNLIANFSYKIMECDYIMKNKSIKEMSFHLIGYIVKKYNQSMTVSLKIVQMLQHFEHLPQSLAEATVLWHDTYKCKSIVTEVLRELGYIQEKELLRDSSISKAASTYLMELGKHLPAVMLANISLVVVRLNEEAYMLRNCVLSIMGDIILACLSKEGLDESLKKTRDQFFCYLHDHAYLDPVSYVRCKAVHVWTNLVKDNALPVKRYPELITLSAEMLFDKSNLVRKATVQLLQSILTCNPFGEKLPLPILEQSLEENENKLEDLLKSIKKKQQPVDEVFENENEDESKSEMQTTDAESETETKADSESAVKSTPNQDEYPDITDDERTQLTKLRGLVEYLKDSISFLEEFQAVVPVLCKYLRSRTQSDVIEAIHFFTVTSKFNLDFTFIGVGEMLEQIWNDDVKVKECVVSAYKALYFTPEYSSAREAANIVADNLMEFCTKFTLAQLKSLEHLLVYLAKSKEQTTGLTQVLWERFSMPEKNNSKSTETIPAIEQQKLAVKLLGMMGRASVGILKKNLDELVSIGFQDVVKISSEEELEYPADFTLVKNVCTCLQVLQVKNEAAGKYSKAFRIDTQHPIFQKIPRLLVSSFPHISLNWEAFAMEAISTIYLLCKDPASITSQLICDINKIFIEHKDLSRNNMMLSRLFLVLGHCALKELIYWDVHVLSELKRRRKETDDLQEEDQKKKEKAKQKSRRKSTKSLNDKGEENLEDEMGLGGVTADDAEQEYVRDITENKIVQPGTILGHFTPLIARVCLAPVNENNGQSIALLAAAAEALAKYMLVSSKFCEDHLQLLFTLLEKAPHETVRANLVIPISDMCVRFPNLLEPWTSHLYARLKDEDNLVRLYTLKVLCHLILKDMIKVKGHVSQMAWCVVDKDENIATLAKNFFQELSLKGNAVYNVLPDIISRLSNSEIRMQDDTEFRVVMKFLFLFIKKEKHIESLVEKLCHRMGATRDKRQWCDISYCLSLLPFSEKCFRKMQANFTGFADKLSEKQVYDAFVSILTKLKKGAKEELRVQIEELESLLSECHQRGVSDENTANKAANIVKKTRKTQHMKSPRHSSAWVDESGEEKLRNNVSKEAVKRKPRRRMSSDDDSLEEEDASSVTRSARVARRRTTVRRVPVNIKFSSSESDDEDAFKENTKVDEDTEVDLIEESSPEIPLISRRKSIGKKIRA